MFCLFHPVQYRVVAFITVFLVSFCDVYDRIHRVTHTLFSLIPLARVALFLCLVVQRNNGPRTPNSCRIFATSLSSKTIPFGPDIVVTLNDNVSRTSVAALRRIFPEIGCVLLFGQATTHPGPWTVRACARVFSIPSTELRELWNRTILSDRGSCARNSPLSSQYTVGPSQVYPQRS